MIDDINKMKKIMLNPEFDMIKKLRSIYELFTINMSDDRLINHSVHDYKNLYGHREMFVDNFSNILFTEVIFYYKDRGYNFENINYEYMNTVEFAEYLLEKGTIKTFHTLSCACCSYPVFVDILLSFDDLSITATYSEEKTNRYSPHNAVGNYGTIDNPCVELLNDTKFTYDFKCRSGKIVIANILKELPIYTKNKPTEYISINEKFGMMKMINHWAKHNFLYMQCGNTSPSVLQNGNGEVMIGNHYEDEDCECDCEECICVNPFPEYEKKGYICTDLWAVHIVDYDDFKGFEDKINHILLDVSDLGEDIVVEYNYDYKDWDSQDSVLLTMKRKEDYIYG